MKQLHIAMVLAMLAGNLRGQTTQAVTAADPTSAINALRAELVESFNKGDLDRLLGHLSPDVVITWQNGEVCRGPAEVRAYYDRMMTGPNKIVASVRSDPTVTDRHVYGDWAVSWGEMNDHFTLTDGRDLAMNSKFTATIMRAGEAWKVTSFHLSVNAFDNSIQQLAMRHVAKWVGVVVGIVALIIGLIIGRWIARKPIAK